MTFLRLVSQTLVGGYMCNTVETNLYSADAQCPSPT